MEDREGNLFFATWESVGDQYRGRGVSRWDGTTWTIYATADGLASDYVYAILEDREGDLWFGTGWGVSRYDGETWTTYTTGDGLADNWVSAILEDREGHLWFGTYGGVSRYDGERWTTYTMEDGLADNDVNAILEDRKGNFWFGTEEGGVSRYDGERWTTYTTADGLAYNGVWAILEDREGDLWFGTVWGVSRYDGTWTTYTTADGLAHNVVNAILEDREGHLWFGTYRGVSRYDGEIWTTYTMEDGLADNWVSAILEDREGHLWFGTSMGVTKYRGDRTPPNTFIFDGPEGIIGVAQAFFQYGGGDRYAPGADVQYSYAIKDYRERPTKGDWSNFTYLTSLLTDPLPNGTYTFYVRTKDKAGNVDPTPAERTFTIDLTPPTVLIGSPSNNEIVHGEVDILGSAFDNSEIPDFRSYTLEYGKGSNEDQIPASEWRSIREGVTEPVVRGLLGVWNTEGLYGTYVLRLRAVDGFDHRSKYAITVHVVAAKEEVDPRRGGHITDAAGKVDLYIPPNGIPKSTQVTITPVADEEVPKPSDPQLRLVGRAYDIGRRDLALLKPVTFTMSLDADAHMGLKLIYVDDDNTGYEDGSKEHPFNTIQEGIDAASSGDSVRVAAGTYYENIAMKEGVTVQGAGADMTIISAHDQIITGADNSVIEGFTIVNDGEGKSRGYGWSESSTSIRNNVFTGHYVGIHCGQTGSKEQIINNVIVDNNTGITFGRDAAPIIKNNIIMNNNVHHYDYPEYGSSRISAVISYNNLWNGAYDFTPSPGTGNISADPLFVDPENGNYHVQQNSPCIDAGDPNSPHDPDGTRADIGAFFFDQRRYDGTWRPYDIGPEDLVLLKPAAFTMSLDEEDIQEVSDLGKLCIFAWSVGDSLWHRVGGTFDEGTGKITVALTHFGRFALMEDLSLEEGKRSISDVNCQPRVFSPKGGGYDVTTTISFDLGKRSAVTVKVYDVSGRFKRKLAEGRTLNRGSNAVIWDGRDYEDKIVVSGLYVVTVEAEGKVQTKTVGVLNK